MITYNLKTIIVKDMSILKKFTEFIQSYKHQALTPQVIAAMPDIVALGVYMDFLEQEYGIGISADNANYTIYLIPVDDDSKHFEHLKQYMITNNTIILTPSTQKDNVTSVMNNYINAVIKAIADIITPF